MADYSMVYDRVNKGRGKAALRVGQPFQVWRLTSNGFVHSDDPTYCLLRKLYSGKNAEQRFFPSQVFELVTDARNLNEGDLLIEHPQYEHAQQEYLTEVTDQDIAISDIGKVVQKFSPTFMLVQKRPVHKNIGVRLEAYCQIRRPIAGIPNGDGGYQEHWENSEKVLTLPKNSGIFTFSSTLGEVNSFNPVALIPMQLEIAFIQGRPPENLPTDYIVPKWHFLAPAMWNGFSLKPNDTIITPRGDRLRVHAVQESQIGPRLYQGLAEELES